MTQTSSFSSLYHLSVKELTSLTTIQIKTNPTIDELQNPLVIIQVTVLCFDFSKSLIPKLVPNQHPIKLESQFFFNDIIKVADMETKIEIYSKSSSKIVSIKEIKGTSITVEK